MILYFNLPEVTESNQNTYWFIKIFY